jgi:hypothetical protein
VAEPESIEEREAGVASGSALDCGGDSEPQGVPSVSDAVTTEESEEVPPSAF